MTAKHDRAMTNMAVNMAVNPICTCFCVGQRLSIHTPNTHTYPASWAADISSLGSFGSYILIAPHVTCSSSGTKPSKLPLCALSLSWSLMPRLALAAAHSRSCGRGRSEPSMRTGEATLGLHWSSLIGLLRTRPPSSSCTGFEARCSSTQGMQRVRRRQRSRLA